MPESLAEEVTQNAFFGGRLMLSQPANGHRSGTDAVLLAAAVPRAFAGLLFDIGAGVGAVGLGVALACGGADVTLVENDPLSVDLAGRNISANGLAARARVMACDVLCKAERQALTGGADLVVTNPPFYRADRVRAARDPGRPAAHVLPPGTGLDDWLAACLACLAPGGTLIVVHHAAALPETLQALRPRLGDLTLLPIHPRAGETASRVLLRGRRDSRAPFRLASPFILHEGAGFTPLAAALHAGDAALDW